MVKKAFARTLVGVGAAVAGMTGFMMGGTWILIAAFVIFGFAATL